MLYFHGYLSWSPNERPGGDQDKYSLVMGAGAAGTSRKLFYRGYIKRRQMAPGRVLVFYMAERAAKCEEIHGNL